MTISLSSTCSFFLLSYYSYPKNHCFSNHLPALQYEFNDIYKKEITKRYCKHEIKRLSKRKNRKRKIAAVGRHFKLDLKDRFLMLLVYYRLYITYTLAGFLFDLDQINICRDIQKIEGLIREQTSCIIRNDRLFLLYSISISSSADLIFYSLLFLLLYRTLYHTFSIYF